MTVDIHYSVRADAAGQKLYFKPAKLNGVVLSSRDEVVRRLLCTVYFVLAPSVNKSINQ